MKPTPLSIGRQYLLSEDIEIPVIRADLVEDALWVVPLIEHRFNLILPFTKPKSNRSFIGLSSRATFRS